MSHFTTIKTQIKDIDALRSAVQEMGLSLLQKTTARGYGACGETDIEARAREILTLTKMNWNSAEGIGRHPITILFARKVGIVMTEMDEDATPNPLYRFYM